MSDELAKRLEEQINQEELPAGAGPLIDRLDKAIGRAEVDCSNYALLATAEGRLALAFQAGAREVVNILKRSQATENERQRKRPSEGQGSGNFLKT